MKKSIIAFSIVLLVFMYNQVLAEAVFVDECPEGYHYFIHHQESGSFVKPCGTHSYLYGYDLQNRPIYDTCSLTGKYKNCTYLCRFCGTEKDGSQHEDLVEVYHSKHHD